MGHSGRMPAWCKQDACTTVEGHHHMLQPFCSLLRSLAVPCSPLQSSAVPCSPLQSFAARINAPHRPLQPQDITDASQRYMLTLLPSLASMPLPGYIIAFSLVYVGFLFSCSVLVLPHEYECVLKMCSIRSMSTLL